MPDQSVAASAARGLLDFAVSRGARRDLLLARAGIAPADLSNPDDRVPFAKYVALMRAAQELCQDPAFALHFGESVPISEISFAAMIPPESRTGADGFVEMNRYLRLIVDVECEGDGDRFKLVRNGGQLLFVDARKNPNSFPELTESTFARAVHWSRPTYGHLLKAIHVTHAAPSYRAEYDRIFRVPVTFGSEWNAMVVDDGMFALFAKDPAALSRSVTDVLKAHAEELLVRLDATKSVRARVEQVLLDRLPKRDVGIESVSRELGLSRQTLFRRLKAEQVTYEQVLDALRRKLALELLDGKHASVNDTAYRVGFSDPAAFSRAFKRWTGESPRRHVRGA
jgi:AraC-like DNA-binding protein